MRCKVMERIENVKKKHHFVFQAYLSKWKENNAVGVLRDRKKLFPTGTEAIAFKNSFYTINSLNLDEKFQFPGAFEQGFLSVEEV